jgi:translation initiation factor 2B subunit (eIF-2B alpha/beta/delta family)
MEDFTRRVAEIREDREHGSRWLVRQTILLLRDVASEEALARDEPRERARQVGRELAQARPAMAALAGAVRRVLAAGDSAVSIARGADQLLQEYEQATARITDFARPHLRGTIMTHSLSGTVLDVLRACIPPIEHVILLEGRPLYEGRTVARALDEQNVRRTLITDAQADIFLPFCQALIVGADSILADGSILNKAGTALLARAARDHRVPLYVLSETLKVAPRGWSGDLALLEEHSGSEVWEQSPPGVIVRNFYFDHTPAELITQIISERGPLSRAQIRDLAEVGATAL